MPFLPIVLIKGQGLPLNVLFGPLKILGLIGPRLLLLDLIGHWLWLLNLPTTPWLIWLVSPCWVVDVANETQPFNWVRPVGSYRIVSLTMVYNTIVASFRSNCGCSCISVSNFLVRDLIWVMSVIVISDWRTSVASLFFLIWQFWSLCNILFFLLLFVKYRDFLILLFMS